MLAETVCDLARPLLAHLPAGRRKVLSLLGSSIDDSPKWLYATNRRRTFFDASLDAHVVADLADWSRRWHYYTGEHHDGLNPAVITSCLRPGDIYIDVGANVGIHSLHASRQVGELGKVLALEPNPHSYRELKLHVEMNRRENIIAINTGAGDCAKEIELVGEPLTTGTFSAVRRGHGTETVKVKVMRIDDLVGDLGLSLSGRRTLVKVDVEGYEFNVLSGMPRLLANPSVLILVEVTPDWLKVGGHSVDELAALVEAAGFRPLCPQMRRTLTGKLKWTLRDGTLPTTSGSDIALVTPQSALWLGDLYEPDVG